MHTKLSDLNTKQEPIAIVGVASKFAGANNNDEFWRLLEEGVCAVEKYPKERSSLGMDLDEICNESECKPGQINTTQLASIQGIDEFDRKFFEINSYEASSMDPQQRIALQLVWIALEDAGIKPSDLRGSDTSVYAGTVGTSYWGSRLFYQDHESLMKDINSYSMSGVAASVLSGRIAYFYDLRGEAVTVDSACSSSLTAAHSACRSIWSGDSEVSIVLGTNVIITPDGMVALTSSNMLAQDGSCKSFAYTPGGYGRGEGCGAVILMPYEKALEKGCNIYGCILASGINNDGRSGGHLLAPSIEAQNSLIKQTWKKAGLELSDAQYVEAHGSATAIGDYVETEALNRILKEDPPETKLLIGSAKSNINHCEGAAGVAGLCKLALSLKKRKIPMSVGAETLNPEIKWQDMDLEVCRETIDWPSVNGLRLAGVNSFGLSGTNVHMVIASEEYQSLNETQESGGVIVPFSAFDRSSLISQLSEFLSIDDSLSIYDVAHTMLTRRDTFSIRKAFVAESVEELKKGIKEYLNFTKDVSAIDETGRIESVNLYWNKQDIIDLIARYGSEIESSLNYLEGYPAIAETYKHYSGVSLHSGLNDITEVDADILVRTVESLFLHFWYEVGVKIDNYELMTGVDATQYQDKNSATNMYAHIIKGDLSTSKNNEVMTVEEGGEFISLLQVAAAKLWENGADVRLESIENVSGRYVDLPKYSFTREKYWFQINKEKKSISNTETQPLSETL